MKKIVVSGLVAGVADLIIGTLLLSKIFEIIFPGLSAEYETSGLFRPWSDPLMSLVFIYPFVLGLIIAFVWDKTKKLVSGKDYIEKGLRFGCIYWLITGIPGMLMSYSSFPVSFTMILSWSLTGLVDAVLAGVISAKLNA